MNETLTIQIIDERHPDYQCVFWGVRWTDDPAFVTYHNGSHEERLHVSQFRQVVEREPEPGVYAATEAIEALLAREGLRRAGAQEVGSWCIQVGEALVRVCPAGLRPEPSEDEHLAALVIQCLERYGHPPADLAIICPDCGEERCQCEGEQRTQESEVAHGEGRG